MTHLDRTRHNTIRTRNARLAALHAFFRYLAATDPRFLARAQSVLGVPFKRQAHPVEEYLEREEVACLFRHIDPLKSRARRDEAILRLLY
ncbi:MAG: integrase, partial [Nitrospiria bacterium]